MSDLRVPARVSTPAFLAVALSAQTPDSALDLRPGTDGGAVEIVDVALPDAVPPPVARIVEARADGDVVVAPAGGDPFFLSFSAGDYYPPADEVLDPDLVVQAWLARDDGRSAKETYAYLMVAKRLTRQRQAELERLGARVLGFRPHNNWIVAVRSDSLDPIARHPDVRWLGVAQPWQKIGPMLARALESGAATGPMEIWVSLYESDENGATERVRFGEAVPIGAMPGEPSPDNPDPRPYRTRTNGWQERALAALGVEVLDYTERNPAFRVRAVPALVPALAAFDFVQLVDVVTTTSPAHDESTPMVHSDLGRAYYSGGTNLAAVVGQADSGIYNLHNDLIHIAGVGWDPGGGSDPWTDWCGHGSHVAGTIFGDGSVDAGHRGNAPGSGWGGTGRVFNVKIFDSACNGTALMQQIIAIMRQAAFSTPKPHAINNSHGCGVQAPPYGCGGPFYGTEQDAVDLDSAVYNDDQAWIFASGNEGPSYSTVRLHGSAKNVLTVGSVIDHNESNQDPGEVTPDSSRGPTADGRWKPNVCAPGHSIVSVQSQTANGYVQKSGTSMSTPHVTGVASQLADAYAFLRYSPARLASLLMATALTRDDQTLTQPTDLHLRNYGAGRVDAMRALFGSSDFGWQNWGFALASGQATYADFTVGAGATRLVVCMHYVEPPNAVGSGVALRSNFDLYLDQDPIDPALNVGDWFAQQSAVDNTEIRILNFPQAGAWRWKVWPQATVSSAKFGVTVAVIYGDTTPDGTLSVAQSKAYVQPWEALDVTATVSNPSYVASAVFLDSIPTAGSTLYASTTTLYDGAVTNLLDNSSGGYDVVLGNIWTGASRSARWTMSWASEGWKTWTVNARSDNWVDEFGAVDVGVDGTGPATPSGLASATHTINVWSNLPDVYAYWNVPSDNLSGVAGYSWLRSEGGTGTPGTTLQLTTPYLWVTLPSTASGWWINVRAVDQAANWSGTGSIGPFKIDTTAPVGPSNFASSTHYVGVPSCSTTVNVQWTSASDAHSGLSGYVGLWDASPSSEPTGASNLGAGATSYTSNIGSSPSARYFHLRARDNAGNLGHTTHFGPIYADANGVWSYCTGKTNSLGCVPSIGWSGQPTLGGGFTVACSNVISQRNGLLYWGLQSAAYPFQGGWQCVSAPFIRTYIQSSGGSASGADCSGSYAFDFDSSYLYAYGLMPGTVVYCQWWMRDPAIASTTGLSNALRFSVCE